jgi:hypothetical protein
MRFLIAEPASSLRRTLKFFDPIACASTDRIFIQDIPTPPHSKPPASIRR